MTECDVYVSTELGLIKWHISESLCLQFNHCEQSPKVEGCILEGSSYIHLMLCERRVKQLTSPVLGICNNKNFDINYINRKINIENIQLMEKHAVLFKLCDITSGIVGLTVM